jgi:hypothetical protein
MADTTCATLGHKPTLPIKSLQNFFCSVSFMRYPLVHGDRFAP